MLSLKIQAEHKKKKTTESAKYRNWRLEGHIYKGAMTEC